MNTILQDVKTQLELSNVSLIDNKLLMLTNMQLSNLMSAGVPVKSIEHDSTPDEFTEIYKDGYYPMMLEYVSTAIRYHLNSDKMSNTTKNVLESIMVDKLHHLMVVYDYGKLPK